ncbi:MAG: ribosomal protein S18-alanine N-acetyltransferase [Armatimonadetes bacterium]|nr:ribosomal protein S18-alanine N-acetyltransferase [Armatimonadota bacterium]
MLATLRFVPLDKTHIPRILEIEHVTHSAPWSQKSFENELEHKYGVFLVGLVDGDVGAYGGVWILVDEAHVTNVVVCEHLRNQGIGRKLMIELLTRAREKGAVCATLEVRASNVGAIHLYETLGFVQSTVRNKYYPDNQEDAVVMMLNDLLSWKPGV